MINLKVKDYSVSNEIFTLVKNNKYGYLETTPQPKLNELASYYESTDYISHTNSKRNLFEKIYHTVREITLKQKINLIKSQHESNQKHVLDIGCGTGHFLKSCLNEGWNITGVEPNPQARSIASQLTKKNILDSKELFQLKPSSFDVITLWHVLEHLPDLEQHMQQFKNLLKPNGVLIVAVPNYKSDDASYYGKYWAAYDVPRHLWHFDKKSINALSKAFNLKLTQTKPMWFDAFYVSLLSEKYKTGQSNFLKSFWIGLRSNLKSLRNKEFSSLIYIIKHN